MKQKKPKAFIPIYAFALGWIVCAFFIPMYTLGGLVGSAAVSAMAASIWADGSAAASMEEVLAFSSAV